MQNEQLILGFETSCDETAIALMKGDDLLINKISSQVEIHEKFGGVVDIIDDKHMLVFDRMNGIMHKVHLDQVNCSCARLPNIPFQK